MKAQCDKCKEIVPLEFEVTHRGIEVRCPDCLAVYFVASTAARPATPLPSGDMTCPKCGEAQPRADACRRCGLVQERWRGAESAAEGTEADLADAREAAALWEATVAAWDDPARHEAFLNQCQRTGSYAFAAARYKTVPAKDGEPDPIAALRLKQVRSLAEFALLKPPGPGGALRSSSPYTGTIIVLAIGLVLLAGAFIWVLIRRH